MVCSPPPVAAMSPYLGLLLFGGVFGLFCMLSQQVLEKVQLCGVWVMPCRTDKSFCRCSQVKAVKYLMALLKVKDGK